MNLYKNKKLLFELTSFFAFAVLVSLSPDSTFNSDNGEKTAIVQVAQNISENIDEVEKVQEEAEKEAAAEAKDVETAKPVQVTTAAVSSYTEPAAPQTPETYETNSSASSDPLTPQKGVVYYNGHRETYYSQKVLPGGGLDIPGRHVAEDGTVRDADGYICVASSDHSKGTVVETSLGTAKVYDSGCASGTVDIYTNW